MRPMKPDPGIRVQAVRIPTENGGMSALLLSPLAAPKKCRRHFVAARRRIHRRDERNGTRLPRS